MASLSLKINIVEKNVIKTMQFDPNTTVFDACKIIRDKSSEANVGQPKDYGIFLSDEDPKKGVWLEPGRTLGYYLLRNGDVLEYVKKVRTLKVRMLDGSVKTILVDDSQPVANLMVVICTKIGITNHDEYSLVRDVADEDAENKSNFGTLTMRRKKDDKDRDVKMEQLKKKIRTDDEINWVDQSKTLREIGIDETETVLLRRKYFFSDGNVDSHDPVQLNLLYVQARDSILNGTHPVTVEQACTFAGIQCQAQFGDHHETKHKSGFLDLKEFLPQSYLKMKGVEKKIFAEHKKHTGLTEIESKVVYVKTARSLSTFGVAFFLVKEKLKGKNKLVPRLLGVTKDSVLRLDEKTKEILKVWPLTTVRRWAASPNTFTLDFGDYSDQYYSVQTTEGEQISQLIAGYIDIILKKKQAKDHFGIEGDEGSTMVEDSVSPHRATIVQHEAAAPLKSNRLSTDSVALPAVMRAADSPQPIGTGQAPPSQKPVVQGQVTVGYAPSPVQQPLISSVLSEPQRALVGTLGEGQRAISEAEVILETTVQVPELGTDSASLKWKQTQIDTSKQNITSQIAAMNAATASVVTLTSGPAENIDHQAVGAAISTISSNLPEVARGVKLIAALTEEKREEGDLIEAARKLCSAFSELLTAAQPDNKDNRQDLLGAATRVGEASHGVLTTIGEETVVDKEVHDILLGLAKAVANTAAALVLQAKGVAATCEDEASRNQVISAATQCALATSQLVACAKVVAPTIDDPACQQHLINAAREVARAVEAVIAVCQINCKDPVPLGSVTQAAAEVTAALNNLLSHIKDGPRNRAIESIHEGAVDNIMAASDRLFAAQGDAAEMVKQARILAQATAQLIQAIKGEAESMPDSDLQQRLLAAARSLADATARMVEAAKSCASNPNDAEQQLKLRKAAEDLRAATNAAAGDTLKKKTMKRLETAAKHAAATATQNIAAAQAAGHYNTSPSSQEHLMQSCKIVADHVTPVIQAVKGTMAHPDSPDAQITLVSACEDFLRVGNVMVSASKAALPTVSDSSSSLQLSNSTKQYAQALIDLGTALGRAREVCGHMEIDWALDILVCLREELEAFKRSANSLSLKPLPGETAESAAQHLTATSKSVGSTVAQLLTASSQGNERDTRQAARNTVSALQDLTNAVRAVAATTDDSRVQHSIIDSAKEVITLVIELIKEAKTASVSPQHAGRLSQVARDVSHALNKCVACLPGQRDVDEVIGSINEATKELDANRQFARSGKSYHELQTMLGTAAVDLNNAVGEVAVSARETPTRLAASSRRYGQSFGHLMGVGVEIAGQTKDTDVRGQMVVSLKSVSMVSTQLLTVAKTVNADPQAPNTKNQLSAAARAVTEAINNLVDVCTAGAPGQKECDNAIRAIQSTRPLLENATEPANNMSYFDCLEAVMEKSKNLGDGMTGIANSVKRSEYEPFGEAIKSVAAAICGLVEAAAQAAYLVGISEPSSATGRSGLIDQAAFSLASQAIRAACSTLCNPSSSQPQVLSAATVIAKHTSTLCNACRTASSKSSNPVAKRQFVQSAKEVANATAILVKEIKNLDQDYSDRNRQNCAEATEPLLQAVDNLCTFANSPEFAPVAARISKEGRLSQEPIISAGESIIEGSCAMILAAKSLAANPKDPPAWQELANQSKSVSESIKDIVSSIRDKAPGQKECDEAIANLSTCLRQLNQVYSDAVSQHLQPRRDKSAQGFAENLTNSATEILQRVDTVRFAAEGEAEKLGHAISHLVNYYEPLVISATGSASHLLHSKQQLLLLDQTKTVTECALQLAYAAKEAGGNPKAVHVHNDLRDAAECLKESLRELLSTVETLSTEAGIVSGLVDGITTAMQHIEITSGTLEVDKRSFNDYHSRMVAAVREIVHSSQEMVARSGTGTGTGQLGPLAAGISHNYTQLAADTRRLVAKIPDGESSSRIKSTVRDLGQACIYFVRAAGVCQSVPGDAFAHRDLAEAARVVEEKASLVLAALQTSCRASAASSAASTVSGIIGDVDTTILFATAGTLNGENDDGTFSSHGENILKTAKALVEDTKTLVAGAATSQEQLAAAAQSAVATIVQLAEAAKMGSAIPGPTISDTQALLVNAVQEVVIALGNLINATRTSPGVYSYDLTRRIFNDSVKYPAVAGGEFDTTTGVVTDTEHSDWLVSDQEEELIRLLTTDSDFAEAEIAVKTIHAR